MAITPTKKSHSLSTLFLTGHTGIPNRRRRTTAVETHSTAKKRQGTSQKDGWRIQKEEEKVKERPFATQLNSVD
jgi:hypothetical protein